MTLFLWTVSCFSRHGESAEYVYTEYCTLKGLETHLTSSKFFMKIVWMFLTYGVFEAPCFETARREKRSGLTGR